MPSHDDTDIPVEPDTNVVDIGDIRVARGFSRRPHKVCPHCSLIFDQNERRVWCEDCKRNIDPFDVVVQFFHQQYDAKRKLARRLKKIQEAEEHALVSLAAREMDKAWRKRSMVPACPHCNAGLWPEDFKNGVQSMVGKEYDSARRSRKE